ncbi:MAG: hypothetical protein K2N87_17195 [Eubacterium sp.]|nr:hypothetical protein [Eubacterium sp.]
MRQRLPAKKLKKRLKAHSQQVLSAGTGKREKAGYENALQAVVRLSGEAFYEGEAMESLSCFEFLYLQSQWVRKRWWVMQGLLLAMLWYLLKNTDSSLDTQKYMGILAPFLAMLILPELWKNRSCQAVEVEGAAYYSLRQIYAARMFLFVIVDTVLFGTFVLAGICSGRIALQEMLAQFLLPYFVTCCICFRTLYSRRVHSEAFALLLCIAWCVAWMLLVLDEKIYSAVELPVWAGMTAVSALYLGYCMIRAQTGSMEDLVRGQCL